MSCYQSALDLLTNAIDKKQKEKKLPIYIIKSRIKAEESTFLKTKRDKAKFLSDITDYAGIRILCLFKQDLEEIHDSLLEICKDLSAELGEITLYNWGKEEKMDRPFEEDKRLIEAIMEHSKASFPDIIPAQKIKESGYKSLHYIIKVELAGKNWPVEIQLRTILQDAWGELEHSLSYKKGNIHPHVKKSFVLLSRDLDTNDYLLSHLKSIVEKERYGTHYSIRKAGPTKWLDYEDNLIPDELKEGERKTLLDQYRECVRERNPRQKIDLNWLKDARQLFDKFANPLPTWLSNKKEVTLLSQRFR